MTVYQVFDDQAGSFVCYRTRESAQDHIDSINEDREEDGEDSLEIEITEVEMTEKEFEELPDIKD